jgi:hypothetical protein
LAIERARVLDERALTLIDARQSAAHRALRPILSATLGPAGYRQRTRANLRDSDAMLIVSIAPELTGGSRETLLFAQRCAKRKITAINVGFLAKALC